MILLLALILSYQIIANYEESERWKKQNSLDLVNTYYTSESLDQSKRHIWEATNKGKDYSKLDNNTQRHIISILNYFDIVAICVNNEQCDSRTIHIALGENMEKYVTVILEADVGPNSSWVPPAPPFESSKDYPDLISYVKVFRKVKNTYPEKKASLFSIFVSEHISWLFSGIGITLFSFLFRVITVNSKNKR